MKRLRTSIGVFLSAGLLGPLGLAIPAAGAQPTTVRTAGPEAAPVTEISAPHDRIVNDDPADHTPHVLDGQVLAVAEVGDTIVLGGRFSQVSSADGADTYPRDNLVAFDRETGEIDQDFAPSADSDVTSLAVAADGESVYAGGFFDTVDGTATRGLAKLRLADGEPDPDFRTPTLNGRVKDLALVGDRLWIAGAFTHVDGSPQAALATVRADTGEFDPYVGLAFEDPRNDGVRQVLKLAVTPDSRNLVAIGNFTTVDGEPRSQAAMLNLNDAAAGLAQWHTDFFTTRCSSSFESYLRDVDVSPDGRYFVAVTAGSYWGGPPASCDTASRFEVEPGEDVGEDGTTAEPAEPTWVAYTGGDTNLSVAVTGAAVYTGGHFRWQNNPYGPDEPGRGAVSREGVAALDPSNGAPLTWNPTRTLGVGTSDILATETGLWTASDTDRLGGEYHGRIGFFPLRGGAEMPAADPGDLPADVYTFSSDSSDGSDGSQRLTVQHMTDPTDPGERTAVPDTGLPAEQIGDAFMLGEQLHVARRDGTFARLDFDGEQAGEPVPIDAADQLVPDDAWHDDLDAITGAFFHHGRIYYTIRGDDRLFYRAYALQSGVVGAERKVAADYVNGAELWRAGGLMLVGGSKPAIDGPPTLLIGNESDGNLRTVDFADGRPSGEASVISGPETDGLTWDSGPLFLYSSSG